MSAIGNKQERNPTRLFVAPHCGAQHYVILACNKEACGKWCASAAALTTKKAHVDRSRRNSISFVSKTGTQERKRFVVFTAVAALLKLLVPWTGVLFLAAFENQDLKSSLAVVPFATLHRTFCRRPNLPVRRLSEKLHWHPWKECCVVRTVVFVVYFRFFNWTRWYCI